MLGVYDDFKKIKYSNSSGISSKFKITSQIILAIIGVSLFVYFNDYQNLNNNDYLMIKASLATGFNDIVKDLKGLH